MRKDAYYFSHDSNSKDDPKCMLLIDQLGLEGYGIFWVLIETLRDQPEYKYPLNLVPILARRYNTSAEKMLAVVTKYNLFEVDDLENFFSMSLKKRMMHLEGVREKRRLAGLKSGDIRRLNALNKCSTDDEQEVNKNEQSIVKESKEKKNKYSNEIKNFTATLTKYFPDNIVSKLKKTDKYNWIDTIDKLVRLDDYTEDDILKAVKFARNDDFWSKNFLSVCKLRRKDNDKIKYIDVFLHQSHSNKKNDSFIEYKFKGQALQKISSIQYESQKHLILNNEFDIEPRHVS